MATRRLQDSKAVGLWWLNLQQGFGGYPVVLHAWSPRRQGGTGGRLLAKWYDDVKQRSTACVHGNDGGESFLSFLVFQLWVATLIDQVGCNLQPIHRKSLTTHNYLRLSWYNQIHNIKSSGILEWFLITIEYSDFATTILHAWLWACLHVLIGAQINSRMGLG